MDAAKGESDNDEPTPQTSLKLPERAIIFIPHLGHADGRSIVDFATRLAARLNQTDRRRPVTYEVGETAQTVRFGRTSPKTSASAVTVVRKAEGRETSLGIYEFSYSSSFLGRFDKKSSWKKALGMVVTVVTSLSLLSRSFVRGRRRDEETLLRWSVYANVLMIAGAIVYAVVDADSIDAPVVIPALTLPLVSAGACVWLRRRLARRYVETARSLPRVVTVGASAIAAVGGVAVSKAYPEDWGTAGKLLLLVGMLFLLFAWIRLGNPDLDQQLQLAGGFVIVALIALYAIVLVCSALGLGWGVVNGRGSDALENATAQPWAGVTVALTAIGVTFSPKALRTGVENAATHVVGAIRYLSHAVGKDSERGRLYELVEHLAQLGYRSIDVVGYSFGSVLALDALYRRNPRSVPDGTQQVVKRLVTIGCPIVTIGTFWPGYWEGRTGWGGEWINLYSPLDVLSSNLCPPAGAATQGWIPAENRGASSLRPTREECFNHTESSTKLSARDKLLVGGLTAHAQYWEREYAHDSGAVAEIADLWSGVRWSGRT